MKYVCVECKKAFHKKVAEKYDYECGCCGGGLKKVKSRGIENT